MITMRDMLSEAEIAILNASCYKNGLSGIVGNPSTILEEAHAARNSTPAPTGASIWRANNFRRGLISVEKDFTRDKAFIIKNLKAGSFAFDNSPRKRKAKK